MELYNDSNINKTITGDYIYVWTHIDNKSIRLCHVYGKTPECILPDEIQGFRVIEIAEYCFSGKSSEGIDENLGKSDMTSLSDGYIETLVLPDSIKNIGRLAFYNCRNLKRIEMGQGIEAVGADAFMNCVSLGMLVLRGYPQKSQCLRQLLIQISWCIRVCWRTDEIVARACFFEYDQSYDEIGPAHIFRLNVNGEGFRARQCFGNQLFLWKQYDEIFREAEALETEHDLLDMAFYRLIYPYELSDSAKQVYLSYIALHMDKLEDMIVKERNIIILEKFIDTIDIKNENITSIISKCSQAEWTEAAALVLKNGKERKHLKKKDRFAF